MNLNTAMNLGQNFAHNRLRKYKLEVVKKQAKDTREGIVEAFDEDIAQWWFTGVMEVLDANNDNS